jgi:transposase/transposase-like protein
MQNTDSVTFRQQAVEAYLNGKGTLKALSAHFGVGLCTLHHWVSLSRSGASLAPKKSREPALSPQQADLLRSLALSDPSLSRPQLFALFLQHIQKSVCIRTLDSYLKKMGIQKRFRQKKTVLPKKPSSQKISKKEKPTKQSQSVRKGSSYNKKHRRSPDRENRTYPSDLTDTEWNEIKEHFNNKDPRGNPGSHSKREILNAIMYILRTGCQWRMLPFDFPPHKTVYSNFTRWTKRGIFEKISHVLRKKYRAKVGRNEEPSLGIVDSQSVKATEKGGL